MGKSFKRVFVLTLLMVMLVSQFAFAATGNIYENGELLYTANQVRADVTARNHVRSGDQDSFQMRVGEALFRYRDVVTAFNNDSENYLDDLVANYEPYEQEEVALEVVSVEAITDTIINQAEGQYLEFTVNDGVEVTMDELEEAGYEVEFQSNRGIFADDATPRDLSATETTNSDGLVTEADISGVTTPIRYSVEISDEDGVVATSALKTLTLLESDDWAEVQSATLVYTITAPASAEVSVLVDGDVGDYTLHPVVAVDNEGDEVDLPAGESYLANWAGQVDEVVSSNVAVVTVDTDGTDVDVTPIGPGTATITVTLNNEFEFTYDVEVKADAREATTAAADDATFTQAEDPLTVEVTVLDQYGDPMLGETIFTVAPLNDDEDGTIFVQDDAETEDDGVAEVDVELNADSEEGTFTIYVSTTDPNGIVAREDALDDVIGSFQVTYVEAGDTIVSYDLRIHPDSESDDLTIDAYLDGGGTPARETDNEVSLRFAGLDANGILVEYADESTSATPDTIGFNASGEFDVTLEKVSGDDDAATLEVAGDSGNTEIITVTAAEGKEGVVRVVVKEGATTVATKNVSVVWSGPEVTGLEVKATAPDLKVTSGAAIHLDEDGADVNVNDLLKILGDEDFTLEQVGDQTYFKVMNEGGDLPIASVRVISGTPATLEVTGTPDDGVNVEAIGAAGATASLTFQLRSGTNGTGTVIGSVVVPVTIIP